MYGASHLLICHQEGLLYWTASLKSEHSIPVKVGVGRVVLEIKKSIVLPYKINWDVWSSLPLDVRHANSANSFKTKLKTHLVVTWSLTLVHTLHSVPLERTILGLGSRKSSRDLLHPSLGLLKRVMQKCSLNPCFVLAGTPEYCPCLLGGKYPQVVTGPPPTPHRTLGLSILPFLKWGKGYTWSQQWTWTSIDLHKAKSMWKSPNHSGPTLHREIIFNVFLNK